MPKMICVCGPNGAGKSTLSRTIAARENLLAIDPDALGDQGLSPIAAGKAVARMTRALIKEGVSFVRESTLTSNFDFTIVREAKKQGYVVELIYIMLESPALAIERVESRKARGGHAVPIQDIIRRYTRSLSNLPRALPLMDRIIILDNSTTNYRAMPTCWLDRTDIKAIRKKLACLGITEKDIEEAVNWSRKRDNENEHVPEND